MSARSGFTARPPLVLLLLLLALLLGGGGVRLLLLVLLALLLGDGWRGCAGLLSRCRGIWTADRGANRKVCGAVVSVIRRIELGGASARDRAHQRLPHCKRWRRGAGWR